MDDPTRTVEDARREMAAFDRLPTALQVFLRSCPVGLSSEEVGDLYRECASDTARTIATITAYLQGTQPHV